MISEISGPERWQRFEENGDLDFAYEMNEDSRFRCNFLKQTRGYGAYSVSFPTKILTLEQLGIPPVVKEFGHLRGGLVLVTGPTGSGKSTTLAALIDYINVELPAGTSSLTSSNITSNGRVASRDVNLIGPNGRFWR